MQQPAPGRSRSDIAKGRSRRGNGEFAREAHSAPEGAFAGASVETADVAWSTQQRAAMQYTPPLRLAGFVPRDASTQLHTAVHWARSRGHDPADIKLVRRAFPTLDDRGFHALYTHVTQSLEDRELDPDGQYDWDAYERFAELVFRDSAGEIPAIDASVEQRVSDGCIRTVGSKFDATKHLPEREVAGLLRSDLKQAQASGFLPPEVTVSVRALRNTSGFRISATVPDDAYDRREHPWSPDADAERREVRPVDRELVAELRDRLRLLGGVYGAGERNSMWDFVTSHRESIVDVHPHRHAV